MKLNELKDEHYFNKIGPTYTQMRIKQMSWGYKSFVLSWSRERDFFSTSSAIINLAQFSILNAFSKVLKTAR